MKDNISPEEKLLRLIRGEKKAKAPKEAIPTIANLKSPLKNSVYSLANIYLTPAVVQKIMVVLLAVSFVCLLASFIYPLVASKKIVLPQVPLKKTEALSLTLEAELKPYEFYLQSARQRQIFGNSVVQEKSVAQVAANLDIVKEMSLVGIISGDNPQAIIEDKATQKTYYVTKGQFIGEIQIEEILEGKIIISYKGQRFELYL